MVSSRITVMRWAAPVLAVLGFWLCTLRPESSDAAAGRGEVAHTSVHAADVHHDDDVNIHDVNVNVDHVGCCYDPWGHPIAAESIAAATAITIGAIVASLPPDCTATVINGITYQVCGGVYYQPVYQGTTLQYQVVQP